MNYQYIKKILSYLNISLHKINDKNGDLIINIPKYPILVGNKIDLNYYSDIFRYLYITKHNLNLPKYPVRIIVTKKEKKRENKKREFKRKAKKYYLDDNNKLYKLIGINNKSSQLYPLTAQRVIKDKKEFILSFIPEKLYILEYINELHIEDGHKGSTSFRNYILKNNIYFQGLTFLIDYIIKNCAPWSVKNKEILKREPSKQIITYYPRERYVMDLTELPLELKRNTNYNYLFNIIEHFSKFGILVVLENKDAKNILQNLKLFFEFNGFQKELGSDNGREFKNKLIENYLNEKNIDYIHGMPYNPHSQGVVERFHKTINDLLYAKYLDNENNFNHK